MYPRIKSVNSQPTAVAVTCVCGDVIQLLSFSKSSPKHFCYDTHAHYVHLCDPDSSPFSVKKVTLSVCNYLQQELEKKDWTKVVTSAEAHESY